MLDNKNLFFLGLIFLLMSCGKNQLKEEKMLTSRFLKVSEVNKPPFFEDELYGNDYIEKNRIHFITEYNDSSEIVSIQEYDSNSIEVFNFLRQYQSCFYPWKYTTCINAKVINDKQEVQKTFNLYSTGFLSICTYKIDSIKDCLQKYESYISYTNYSNQNSFQFINKFHSIMDIQNSFIIKRLEEKQSVLLEEYYFNKKGNIIKIIYYPVHTNQMSTVLNKFNANSQLIYSRIYDRDIKSNLVDSIYSESFYQYSRPNESEYKKGYKRGNLIQKVILSYNWNIYDNKMPEQVFHYEYNNQNQLISNVKYFDGELNSKSTYLYDSLGRKAQEEYFDGTNSNTTIIKYSYNKYSQVKKSVKTFIVNQKVYEVIIDIPKYKYVFY